MSQHLPESLREYSLALNLYKRTNKQRYLISRTLNSVHYNVLLLRECVGPVNNVEGVKVADGTGNLGSIEPSPRLQEAPLPLQVEENLPRQRERE